MIFTWTPDSSPSNTPKERVEKVQFGDGYAQRLRTGINTSSDSWSLSFSNRSEIEGKEIISFLKARGGVEPFDWTAPGDLVSRRWICESGAWSYKLSKGNIYSISARFEEVFE